MEKINVLAAAALQSEGAQITSLPLEVEPAAAAGARRSLRTASNISASSAGKHSVAESDSLSHAESSGSRIKGKMTQYERFVTGFMSLLYLKHHFFHRDLVDSFVAGVKSGSIVVPKGSLARMLQEHVNKSRHITFFEKLVSRRKLNQELASLFAPREPRTGDKLEQSGDGQQPIGGQKCKRGRRRRSAKEALLSLLDNPELVSLMQRGGLMGAATSEVPNVTMQMPHGLPAVLPLSSSGPQLLHPHQLSHTAAPAAQGYLAGSGGMAPFMPHGGYYSSPSSVPTPALPSGPVGYAQPPSMTHGVPPSMRFAPAYMPSLPGMHATSATGSVGMPLSASAPMVAGHAHAQQHNVFWNTMGLPAGSRALQQMPPSTQHVSAFSNGGSAMLMHTKK